MSDQRQFKLVWQKMGSGWDSLHVAVDNYWSFPEQNPESRNEIILTHDTDCSEDTLQAIEELIDQLRALKRCVRGKWTGKQKRS